MHPGLCCLYRHTFGNSWMFLKSEALPASRLVSLNITLESGQRPCHPPTGNHQQFPTTPLNTAWPRSGQKALQDWTWLDFFLHHKILLRKAYIFFIAVSPSPRVTSNTWYIVSIDWLISWTKCSWLGSNPIYVTSHLSIREKIKRLHCFLVQNLSGPRPHQSIPRPKGLCGWPPFTVTVCKTEVLEH